MYLAIATVKEETYDASDQEIGADRDEKEAVDGRKPGGAETGHQPELQGGVATSMSAFLRVSAVIGKSVSRVKFSIVIPSRSQQVHFQTSKKKVKCSSEDD